MRKVELMYAELIKQIVLCDGTHLTPIEAARIIDWVDYVFALDTLSVIPDCAIAMSLAGETHLLTSNRELTEDETWHIARIMKSLNKTVGQSQSD